METFKTTDEYSVAVDNIVDRKKMKYERRQARLNSRRGIGDDEEDEEGEGGGEEGEGEGEEGEESEGVISGDEVGNMGRDEEEEGEE